MKISEIAYKISKEAHSTQKRWNGDPYITHPERLVKVIDDYYSSLLYKLEGEDLRAAFSQGPDTEELKAVAYLHDVLEDNPDWTVARLTKEGITNSVVWSVMLLTKLENEPYFSYLDRLLTSRDEKAINIKVLDLVDNCTGLQNYKKKDRAEKYLLALSTIRYRVEQDTTLPKIKLFPPVRSILNDFLNKTTDISVFSS